jgi:hypothetical protein
MRDRSYYHSLRGQYQPEHLKLVVIAESPPISGKYFYDKSGVPTEPLFSALMQRLNVTGVTKEEGLREFQRRGWILVDATYEQINDDRSNAARDLAIESDYHLLLDDLKKLSSDPSLPIVLLKANVCRLLEPKLTSDGFNVINRGQPIYFPSNGQQNKSKQQFVSILKAAGILP